MALIIGLGNPGSKYEHTRHNVGFDVIGIISQKTGISVSKPRGRALVGEGSYQGRRLMLALPQTFMNLSGESVVALMNWYKIPPEEVLVIYDDIDLPSGAVRLRPHGGAGTHNGMRSIVDCTGTQGFPRIRVGIGGKPEQWNLADWVLSRYTTQEERQVAFDAYMTAADGALCFVTLGIEAAMQQFNRKQEKAKKEAASPDESAKKQG